jgi:hypothetical protein
VGQSGIGEGTWAGLGVHRPAMNPGNRARSRSGLVGRGSGGSDLAEFVPVLVWWTERLGEGARKRHPPPSRCERHPSPLPMWRLKENCSLVEERSEIRSGVFSLGGPEDGERSLPP